MVFRAKAADDAMSPLPFFAEGVTNRAARPALKNAVDLKKTAQKASVDAAAEIVRRWRPGLKKPCLTCRNA
jgi:hypothetical protein